MHMSHHISIHSVCRLKYRHRQLSKCCSSRMIQPDQLMRNNSSGWNTFNIVMVIIPGRHSLYFLVAEQKLIIHTHTHTHTYRNISKHSDWTYVSVPIYRFQHCDCFCQLCHIYDDLVAEIEINTVVVVLL